MDYFVSIENSSYFYWQINLLLESFKDIEFDPIVAIAKNDSKKPAIFAKNILEHKKSFYHNNLGTHVDFPPINKPFSILLALQNKILSTHFAVLHPDMVIVSPLDTTHKENIVFHSGLPDPTFQKHIQPYLEAIAKARNLSLQDLPPSISLGGTIIFRDVDIEFFQRVAYRMINLYSLLAPGSNADFDIAKAAWTITIYEYLGKYSVKGIYVEKQLIDHDVKANLIHYRHGLPPLFSKQYYGQEDFKMVIDPYKALLEYNPTDSTDYLQKLIRRCQSK